MGTVTLQDVMERHPWLIHIEFCGPEGIRNGDVGDWHPERNGVRLVYALQMADPDDSLEIALHEVVEQHLCTRDGVSEEAVTAFDKAWRPHDGIEAPCNDPAAPYYRQHQRAMLVSQAVTLACGQEWEVHDARVIAAYDAIQGRLVPGG